MRQRRRKNNKIKLTQVNNNSQQSLPMNIHCGNNPAETNSEIDVQLI